MGEAKRRREAESKGVAYKDVLTGEIRTARYAGDPMAYINQMATETDAAARGDRVESSVPCAGCNACCYYQKVDVKPDRERPEDLAKLDVVRGEDGGLQLRRREDGACIHLGAEGCTVYDHRPEACRRYDCRAFSLTGVLDSYAGGRGAPLWIFHPRNLEGRATLRALSIAGMKYFGESKRAGKPATAIDVLTYALMNSGSIASALIELGRLPPDKLKETLGFDPYAISREQADEMQGGLIRMLVGDIEESRLPPTPSPGP